MSLKKIAATALVAAGLAVGGASTAVADPAPGGNNPAKVCAPGQHAGSGQLPEPGFKPPACEPGTGNK